MSLGDLNAYMLYAIFVSGSAGGIAGTAASLIAAVSPLQCSSGERAVQLWVYIRRVVQSRMPAMGIMTALHL
jgi:hypothetical protein